MSTDVKVVVKVYPHRLTAAELRELADKLQAELDELELDKVFSKKAAHLIKEKEKDNGLQQS